MKKYKFTGETKQIRSNCRTVTLHRIIAIRNFGNIKSGTLGGWIEKERNLSHVDNAWIFEESMVHGNAKICKNLINKESAFYEPSYVIARAYFNKGF